MAAYFQMIPLFLNQQLLVEKAFPSLLLDSIFEFDKEMQSIKKK